jgi:hypothetical protein
MSYYIQSYGKGFIQRNGDKYELNIDGEVVGSYDSIQHLVDAHPLDDGKQVSTVDEEAAEATVDTTSAPKSSTKSKKAKK